MDEFKFTEELTKHETPEEVRARYPIDGFKFAWVWSDQAPKGIPEEIPGPIS